MIRDPVLEKMPVITTNKQNLIIKRRQIKDQKSLRTLSSYILD